MKGVFDTLRQFSLRDLCKRIWVPDVILFVESSLKSLTVIGEDENLAFMI